MSRQKLRQKKFSSARAIFSVWVWVSLVGVLLFAAITRWYRLGQSAEFIFDERYHVPAVRLMADNDPRAFEWWHTPQDGGDNFDWLHPPLAKYIQAGFFHLSGGDEGGPVAWRVGSAVFGVVGILLVFVVTQLAFKKPLLSVLAAFLLSLDGLWLVQSRVAMNDVFVSVWLLAATAAYLWYQQEQKTEWLLLVGVFGGLGLATKWSAGWWVAGLLVWEVLAQFRARAYKRIPWVIFSLLLAPVLLYGASFIPMFLQGKSMEYFWQLHREIVKYHMYRDSSHAFQSLPWHWFFDARPVWYWSGGEHQNIVLRNNPLLAWFAVVAIGMIGVRLFFHRLKKLPPAMSILLMLYAVSFIPWVSIPRIAFYYHYTPATPFAALFLAYWLHDTYMSQKKLPLRLPFFAVLIGLTWVFWLYYPSWVGVPISEEFSRAIYGVFSDGRP